MAVIAMSLTMACVTPVTAQFGVQADQLARNPARIAVLPCRLWPQGALYSGQASTDIPTEERDALCQRFDSFVLEGFDGQPYMRGLSPKVIKTLLEQNKQASLLSQIDDLWYRPGQACEACRHPASYYSELIAPRVDWRTWLSLLSRHAYQADAVLLPLIVSASLGEINDRGLLFRARQAQLALLLIDSNNGQLIWIGGRTAEIRLPKLSPADTALPSREDFFKNLFLSDLWLEFPGRQIN